MVISSMRRFGSNARGARGGTEGKLGGQADVRGVAGTWKDLTDSVNTMASNLTIRCVTSRASPRRGARRFNHEDYSRRSRRNSELKNTIKRHGGSAQLLRIRSHSAVAREVGTEGKLGRPGRRSKAWPERGRISRKRELHGRQPDQSGSHIAEVTTAVAKGDLSRKITVDVRGEILELKNTSTPWWISSAHSHPK